MAIRLTRRPFQLGDTSRLDRVWFFKILGSPRPAPVLWIWGIIFRPGFKYRTPELRLGIAPGPQAPAGRLTEFDTMLLTACTRIPLHQGSQGSNLFSSRCYW
ncbi:hypothetical protein BS47DRAFT_347419 [Hydnum rufescens UP504]|uniref:Uncharacterized protein n=1 Tax=Hydnum rufescens UP504 TaxID=1448309 RepID=A0A9P6ALQ7_9AGAM|nr:hypothetical protein BS47DRAFT_347419 [Hydnum rufescens UP504]